MVGRIVVRLEEGKKEGTGATREKEENRKETTFEQRVSQMS